MEAATTAWEEPPSSRSIAAHHTAGGDSSSSGPGAAGAVVEADPGLDAHGRACCDFWARRAFPSAAQAGRIQPTAEQGFCSYTLFVGTDTVLQFRPEAHALDMETCGRAREVYGRLVPEIRSLGAVHVVRADGGVRRRHRGEASRLLVYSLSRIPGTSLAAFRRRGSASLSPGPRLTGRAGLRRSGQEKLVRHFALFLAQGWRHAMAATHSSAMRPLPGRVGSSLRWRLDLLRADLPPRFRPTVERVLAHLPGIESSLPWALTHGDVVPGNVMVSTPPHRAVGPRLSGLLDWAEAEYLPFGVGLYGLEELLGESSSSPDGVEHAHYPAPGSTFAYYDDAPALRAAFWAELEAAIPELRHHDGGNGPRELVESARLLGILLWHGIAFDDGRLDRVVQEGAGGVDDAEIQRLDLFLLGRAGVSDPESESEDKVEGPGEAMVHDILDEDDSENPPQEAPGAGSSPVPAADPSPFPSPSPPSSRRQSFGEAARKAWNYVRRLQQLPGKL